MDLGLGILVLLMISLAVRAFLFEIKFQYIRKILKDKHEMFEIFLDCPFCNGFWTGLFGYLITYGIDLVMIPFAILVGSSAYYFTLFTNNLKNND